MPTQALARTIWSLGLVSIAVVIGAAALSASRTGLEVSPLPGALYAGGLALATLVAGFSAAMPRFTLSDERLLGLLDPDGDVENLQAGIERLYLRSLVARTLLNVAAVVVGFVFANETLTTAPIAPFAALGLAAHVLAFPRLHPFLQRIAELNRG